MFIEELVNTRVYAQACALHLEETKIEVWCVGHSSRVCATSCFSVLRQCLRRNGPWAARLLRFSYSSGVTTSGMPFMADRKGVALDPRAHSLVSTRLVAREFLSSDVLVLDAHLVEHGT